MCYFITGIVSGNVHIDELNQAGESFGFRYTICDNPFVVKQLSKGEIYIAKTSGVCDCDTPLGMLNKENKTKAEQLLKKECNKLQSKGWNSTKIERFLAEKHKKEEQKMISVKKELQQWFSFLEKLFSQTQINSFGIMLCWYNSDVRSEQIQIQERITVKPSIQLLSEIEQNKLYIIKRTYDA